METTIMVPQVSTGLGLTKGLGLRAGGLGLEA